MGEVRFMISEAAKQVHVESHVLRYWEEELDLNIGRTEMGHRYYTEEDIQLFCCIRKLKNEGVLLKDLKPLIPRLVETKNQVANVQKNTSSSNKTLVPSTKESVPPKKAQTSSDAYLPSTYKEVDVLPASQIEQAKRLLGDVVNEAITANNQTLENNITQRVTSNILQEMEFLFQSKERLEEEHFRKLDCLIRQQQATRKEAARETPLGRLLRNF